MKFLLGQTYFQQSEYEKALPLLDAYISKSNKATKTRYLSVGILPV